MEQQLLTKSATRSVRLRQKHGDILTDRRRKRILRFEGACASRVWRERERERERMLFHKTGRLETDVINRSNFQRERDCCSPCAVPFLEKHT